MNIKVGKQSAAMDRAQAQVESGEKTGQQAAHLNGLSKQAVYKSRWYKAWKLKQQAKQGGSDGA